MVATSTLILTFFFRFMRELIEEGYSPTLYLVKKEIKKNMLE
jgi:DNA gyrase/topoisomerase IV subunit B